MELTDGGGCGRGGCDEGDHDDHGHRHGDGVGGGDGGIDGDRGEAAVFEVTLTGEAATATELSWSTSGGTATSGEDFTAVSSGEVEIAANATSATLSVETSRDVLAEADETFTVTIAAATLPSGVELGTTTATGTIEDDEVLVASVDGGFAHGCGRRRGQFPGGAHWR